MAEITQFLIAHGLSVIFAVVFVERMGLPIPAFPWLLGAGALSATGQINPFLVIVATVVGCTLGDTFWFYLGKRRGVQVLNWLCRISLEADTCVRRTQNAFARHGMSGLLLASKFLPGLGTVAPPMAGMSGVPVGQFIFVNAIGSLAYAVCGLGIGYFFSNQLEQIVGALRRIGNGALVLLLAMVVLYLALKYWQRKRLLRQLRAARITVAELRQKLEAGELPVILDLRSSAELKSNPTMIRGAVHVELESINNHSYEIPVDRDVVVYCSCPNEVTSARFALMLQKRGLKRVHPLLGGIDAWRKLDYPMETWTSTVTATAGGSGVVQFQQNQNSRRI